MLMKCLQKSFFKHRRKKKTVINKAGTITKNINYNEPRRINQKCYKISQIKQTHTKIDRKIKCFKMNNIFQNFKFSESQFIKYY